MEQVIPQSKVGNKSAAYRRMGWFMAVILVLVLCAAGSLAWFNINMAETSLKQDVERRLQFTAQNKANALSLWFNSMQNQANRLISAESFPAVRLGSQRAGRLLPAPESLRGQPLRQRRPVAAGLPASGS